MSSYEIFSPHCGSTEYIFSFKFKILKHLKAGVCNLLVGERAKQLCSVLVEGHVIKYIHKFSRVLKQNKEFNIILF